VGGGGGGLNPPTPPLGTPPYGVTTKKSQYTDCPISLESLGAEVIHAFDVSMISLRKAGPRTDNLDHGEFSGDKQNTLCYTQSVVIIFP